MLTARLLDDKYAMLYRAGKITGGCFLGRGQEALSASIGVCLRPGDIFSPLIRDAAGRLAFGESPLDAARTFLGSSLGPMRGRDGNVHRGQPLEGQLAMISHLGAMISVVNGMLFARRMRGHTGSVGVASMGEGATSTGAFHEGINQAAIEHLPLVLVIANNRYAYSTPNTREFACQDLADKAAGYGVHPWRVDGTDLEACLKVMGAAIDRARSGGGPQMVVANLLRLCGHGEHDDAAYVDPKLKQSEAGRDCIKVAEVAILERGWADKPTLTRMREEAARQVENATAQAQREPAPDPFTDDWRALKTPGLAEARPDDVKPVSNRGVLDLP
jgi:pyruvate dehydrogenase E1 component alpha subunit/2-oxoisovalerate dehydrogenase E1 component alpha subunit